MEKYRIIDLFSGCGGISLGFSMTNKVEIVGAIDFNDYAIKTYVNNFKNSKVFCGDITNFSVKNTGFKDIDIIVGGPPCQGFSGLNRWNKQLEDDPRNKLFFEFLRFVKELRPKAILIENVRQILTSKNGYAKENIISILDELGYNVAFDVLDCSKYGVPQKRHRAFFIGIKKEIGNFNFNILNKYEKMEISVEEAISDIYQIEDYVINHPNQEVYILEKPCSKYQKEMRDIENTLYDHLVYYPTDSVINKIVHVPQGGNWKNVPEHLFKTKRTNRHSNYLKRLDSKKPSITVDTGHNVYFHYALNRVPTIRESARLQSFPDSFRFYGTKGERFKQVGNAVPPLMAKVLAMAIMEVLEK